MILTKQVLQQHNACNDGIDFCERNQLFGFDLNKLHDITGNHYYFEWLKEIIRDTVKYDANGNVLQQLQSPNKIVVHEYDDRNNRISTKVKYNGSLKNNTPEFFQHTVCEYNSNNNLIFQYNPPIDINKYYIRIEYDDNNNKISMNMSDGSWWLYEYNSNNMLIRKHDNTLLEQVFEYDESNNLIRKDTSNRGKIVETIKYQYDSKNNLIKVDSSTDSWVTYEYDSHNNIIQTENEYRIIKYVSQYYPNGQLAFYARVTKDYTFDKWISIPLI